MINNFSTTIWQYFYQVIWLIMDTLYRVGIRLLYHSKVVGVFTLFVTIIFVTSCGFLLSTSFFGQNISQGFYSINVGQGDSLLYITKENQTFLIDTGKPGDGIVQKLEKILGKYKKKIDVIILTHPDSDHVGEINNIITSFNVGIILYSPIYDAGVDSKKAIKEIKGKVKNKVLVVPVFAGSNLSFSENEKVYFLSPSFFGMTTFINKKELSEDNYYSVVAMIKNNDAIFTMSDAPQKIEKVLTSTAIKDIFNATSSLSNITGEIFNRKDFDKIILKVGHHGSKTSSAPDFIQRLLPTDVILSYGFNNRYGHPHKEVLDLFSSTSTSSLKTSVLKIKIHRTISGTVYFSE